ncbi:MAG: RNA-binding protein hfq [Spirulinaceae cyanobacterium]
MEKFDTGLPSIRNVQGFIKEQQKVEIKLITNDVMIGKLIWQDNQCLCLADESEQSTIVWRQAIAYLQAKG